MHGALAVCREFNGRIDSGAGIPKLYASAGVYPHNTPEIDDSVLAKLDGLLAEPEVIACGEIGLDYYHEGAPHDVQRGGSFATGDCRCGASGPSSSIAGQRTARPTPGTIFSRFLKHWKPTGLGGVMHCLAAGWEQARRSLDMGFLISFAGNLTYPKAQPLRDVAARLPLDACWWRPTRPGWLRRPTAASAMSRPGCAHGRGNSGRAFGHGAEEIAAATTKNFSRLFGLGLTWETGRVAPMNGPAMFWHHPNDEDLSLGTPMPQMQIRGEGGAPGFCKRIRSHGSGKFVRHRQQGGHSGGPQRHRPGAQGDSPALRPEGFPLRGQRWRATMRFSLPPTGSTIWKRSRTFLAQKLVKRGCLAEEHDLWQGGAGAGKSVRQKISLQQGIPAEKAKEIVRLVKDSKKKAQASIQGDTVRISSKDRDVLQSIIALLRGKEMGLDLQFTNYRTKLWGGIPLGQRPDCGRTIG
jgi:TatD DNase family protein